MTCNCKDPVLDPAVEAAVQMRLSQYNRLGATYAMQPNVLHSLGLLPRLRRYPLGLRGLGAVQSVTVAPGSISASANAGDSVVINLPVGNSGAIEDNWAPTGTPVYSFPAGLSITGGTNGGADPITISNVTQSFVGSVTYVDSTSGNSITTTVSVTVAGSSPLPPAPTNTTTTTTSTATIIGIGAAAILAGGLLAYGLSKRSSPAARALPKNVRRGHPKNVRRR